MKYYLDEEAFHTDIVQQCLRQLSILTMNPGLQGFSDDRQRYLILSFTHHCIRASTDSTDLKNKIMQVSDLQKVFEMGCISITRLPALFTWLYKVRYLTDVLRKIIDESQADGTAKELLSHIKSLWDRYLTSTLDQYAFNKRNIDIAGLLFFPDIWDSRWFSLISRASEVPHIFLYGPKEYHYFLREFFEDKNRSGKYHVDDTVYAHAALECFRNMINPNAE